MLRILPGAEGDEAWRQKLEQCKVDNLLNDEIFRRYCLPFVSQQELQSREPALVIPFHSTIDFARNFFDWELAGGDNAYDSTHFATKIRGVGVWFSNYDRLTSASDGLFLANELGQPTGPHAFGKGSPPITVRLAVIVEEVHASN